MEEKMIKGTVYDGLNLERIFTMQEGYMNELKEREAFPDWPLDINIKSNQKILRDIASRCITELSEAFEVSQKITDIAINNKMDDVRPLLLDFNEELADALHFMVEIFVLVGITPHDINKFYDTYLEEMELRDSYYHMDDTMRTMTGYAKHMNIFEGYYRMVSSMYTVLKIDPADEESEVMAGRVTSMDALIKQATELWMVVHALKLAINMLKKKAHREAGPETRLNLFADELIKAWVRLFKYYDMVGTTPISITENYTKKNEKNRQRLKNEY